MKIMAIDLGDVRTGVAFSDLTGFLAGHNFTIHEHGRQRLLDALCDHIAAEKPGRIVVGLPRNMNGTEGPRAEVCKAFAEQLKEATGLPVAMWDERRTTVEAHNILSAHNYHGQKRKNTVDAVAASLILEGYLAFRSR